MGSLGYIDIDIDFVRRSFKELQSIFGLPRQSQILANPLLRKVVLVPTQSAPRDWDRAKGCTQSWGE